MNRWIFRPFSRGATAIAVACGLATTPALAAASTNPASCLGRFGSILIAGGFSGSVDCGKDQISVKSAGEITVSGHKFSILDYRYRLAPVAEGAASHGGQRLLIIEDDRIYVGQFALDTPPFHSIGLRASTVYIDRGTEDGGRIKFSAKGPPDQAFLTQRPTSLFK